MRVVRANGVCASRPIPPGLRPDASHCPGRRPQATYAHCEGIFSSEFKHGPLSAVYDGYPVLFISAPGDESMMVNHVNEVTTRGGRAIALAAEHPALRANVHDYLVIPEADRFLAPILLTVPAQLMSYHMSVARGIDPDFPRNLSKTLTVD